MKKLIIRWVPPTVRRQVKSRVLAPLLRASRLIAGRKPDTSSVLTRYSVPSHETFAGYYEIDPYSADEQAILAHATAIAARSPVPGAEAAIGYFERDSRRFVKLGSTDLWCWQMGSRLRWWPGEARGLAYNARVDGHEGYWLSRPAGETQRISDHLLFDVDTSGKVGLALNFGRLSWARPGYGYPAITDPFAQVPLPRQDGVKIIDIASGEARLVAPLPDIAALSGSHHEQAFHYLNAAKLSPKGSRFSVLHITMDDPNRPDVWSAQAVIGSCSGNELLVVPLPGIPSHYWWINEDAIVYTVNPRLPTATECYYRYSIAENDLKPMHPAAPSFDGHPSLHDGSDRWITDSYPNRYGEQQLFTLEPDGQRRTHATLLHHGRYMGEWRCDLHPRWSKSGKRVVVDSTHEGFRAIYEVEVGPPS